MSTNIVPFTFDDHQVRVVTIDGEPWFVLADLCAVLGLANVGNVASRLDELNIRQADVQNTRGQMRQTIVVNEAGMYEVAIRSDKPKAREFRRWITGTVLPEIRKTGSYNAQPAIADPTSIEGAAQIIQAAQTALAALAVAQPKADAWDELASADGDYEVADAAKILARAGIETGRQRLFTQLSDMGWIYRGPQGKWKARQTAVDAGYLAEKPQSHHHPRTGELVLDPPQVRVTVRGLERLRVRLGSVLHAVEAVA